MWINYNLKEQHSITVDRRGWGREGGEESRGIGQRSLRNKKQRPKRTQGGGRWLKAVSMVPCQVQQEKAGKGIKKKLGL